MISSFVSFQSVTGVLLFGTNLVSKYDVAVCSGRWLLLIMLLERARGLKSGRERLEKGDTLSPLPSFPPIPVFLMEFSAYSAKNAQVATSLFILFATVLVINKPIMPTRSILQVVNRLVAS